MGVMVIACYRPKENREAGLLELMRGHLPVLREQDLVGDDPSLCGRAKDGTIVEVFVWKSQAAIDAAHENPAVQDMWGKFAEVCDFVAISEVEESKQMFSPFEPLVLN